MNLIYQALYLKDSHILNGHQRHTYIHEVSATDELIADEVRRSTELAIRHLTTRVSIRRSDIYDDQTYTTIRHES